MFQGELSRVRPFGARAYHALYRSLLPIRFWLADLKAPQQHEEMPLPPAKLRFRVGESTSPSDFITTGQTSAKNIEAILYAVGHPLLQLNKVLDFGCGSGRTFSEKLKGFQPDWYHTAFQTQAHIQELVLGQLTVVSVITSGFGSHDVVVAQRAP